MFSERYKALGDEVCSGWDCDTLERMAVLVTSSKAAVDVSSPSSSSTESSRQASSFLGFSSLAGSLLTKKGDVFTLRVRTAPLLPHHC